MTVCYKNLMEKINKMCGENEEFSLLNMAVRTLNHQVLEDSYSREAIAG